MTTKYPGQIDNNETLPDVIDNKTPIKAEVVNQLKEAIIAIETELGVKPSGLSANLKARLAAIENSISSLEVISLSNDLGGTLDYPEVIGLRGYPISNATPEIGQLLYFNGLVWAPYTVPDGTIPFVASGDLSGNSLNQTVIGLQGRDISSTTPTNNQALCWNGSSWIPTTLDLDVDEVQSGANYGAYLIIPLSIINSSTSSNTFIVSGTFEFNPNNYRGAGSGTRTITLKVIAETTGPEVTIRLYNQTAGSAVTGTTLNTTAITATLLNTGNISSNLTNGSAIYNLQMSIDTVNPAENADITYAALEIQWS